MQQKPTTVEAPSSSTLSENKYTGLSGYYMAVFTFNGVHQMISVQTDPYPCPYNPNSAIGYTDMANTFEACDIGALSPAPLPANPTIPVYGDSLLQLVS